MACLNLQRPYCNGDKFKQIGRPARLIQHKPVERRYIESMVVDGLRSRMRKQIIVQKPTHPTESPLKGNSNSSGEGIDLKRKVFLNGTFFFFLAWIRRNQRRKCLCQLSKYLVSPENAPSNAQKSNKHKITNEPRRRRIRLRNSVASGSPKLSGCKNVDDAEPVAAATAAAFPCPSCRCSGGIPPEEYRW
jgi:hypothetical protein